MSAPTAVRRVPLSIEWWITCPCGCWIPVEGFNSDDTGIYTADHSPLLGCEDCDSVLEVAPVRIVPVPPSGKVQP